MIMFIINSILLGVGLAMDAFSVSLANGLNVPKMSRGMRAAVPLTFGGFQFLMPIIGWFCVRRLAEAFEAFQAAVPWIALILLLFIGGKMLSEGIKGEDGCDENAGVGLAALMVQGVATSIDALSVGFTIAEYGFAEALLAVVLIAAVTFVICLGGLYIGRKAGTKLAGKAGILGGAILIFIGLEIFITSFF